MMDMPSRLSGTNFMLGVEVIAKSVKYTGICYNFPAPWSCMLHKVELAVECTHDKHQPIRICNNAVLQNFE